MIRVDRQARSGFSLFEIMLALSILGGSLAVLSQIAEIGTSAAREARELATCRMLCQSKLSEVLLDASSGIAPQSIFDAPMESFESSTIASHTQTVEVQQGAIDGLLSVRITIKSLDQGTGNAIATVSLTRWVVDPTFGLEQAEAEELALWEEMTGAGEP